jgi:hypothetical protein
MSIQSVISKDEFKVNEETYENPNRWQEYIAKHFEFLQYKARSDCGTNQKLLTAIKKNKARASNEDPDQLMDHLVMGVHRAFNHLFEHPKSQEIIVDFVERANQREYYLDIKTLMYVKLRKIFNNVLPAIQSDPAFKIEEETPKPLVECYESEIQKQLKKANDHIEERLDHFKTVLNLEIKKGQAAQASD